MAEDIVERLKYWRDLPPGSPLHWDVEIRALCADAIDAILLLRSELKITEDMAKLIDTGPSFREIKDRAKLRAKLATTHG